MPVRFGSNTVYGSWSVRFVSVRVLRFSSVRGDTGTGVPCSSMFLMFGFLFLFVLRSVKDVKDRSSNIRRKGCGQHYFLTKGYQRLCFGRGKPGLEHGYVFVYFC